MPIPQTPIENIKECLKNAKDVFDAVGPFLLGKDDSGILTQGVASARNWIERIFEKDIKFWKYTDKETPRTKEPVAIFPSFQGHEFAVWNDYEQCWDDETGDDYMCDKDKVIGWCEIPPIPEEMKK